MPLTSLWEIQKAVYAALTGDAVLMAKVKGVFDKVPDGQTYPYVTVGDATEVKDDTFTSKGFQATITCHIWSQYPGFKEALEILGEMNRILDGPSLIVFGFSHVYTRMEFCETLRDPDGVTRHVPVRYRIMTEA